MQASATSIITLAALDAGLPEGRVIDQTAKDNLTIARPRVELQFLPERYTRTGRLLAADRHGKRLTRKKELYTVELPVAAHILAEDRAWLADFCFRFVAALPAGVNDSRGNWVKVRAEKATFGRPPDKRVGDAVIEVFGKVDQLYHISFVWRVTATEEGGLLHQFTINPSNKGAEHGEKQGKRRTDEC